MNNTFSASIFDLFELEKQEVIDLLNQLKNPQSVNIANIGKLMRDKIAYLYQLGLQDIDWELDTKLLNIFNFLDRSDMAAKSFQACLTRKIDSIINGINKTTTLKDTLILFKMQIRKTSDEVEGLLKNIYT